jgi:hypothetical protein
LRREAAELYPTNVIPHLHPLTDASLHSTQRFHPRHLDAIIFNLLGFAPIASESLTADFHSPRKTDRSVSQKSLSHSPPMVYDAASLLPRRGLEGGEGIPELTSGTPLHPAHQRSAVVEARERRGGGVQGVGPCAHVAGGEGIGVRSGITTTMRTVSRSCEDECGQGNDLPTTVSFHCRDSHNYKLPRLLLVLVLGVWRCSKNLLVEVAVIEGFVGSGVTVVDACCRW